MSEPCPICTMPMDDSDGGCLRHDPQEIIEHQQSEIATLRAELAAAKERATELRKAMDMVTDKAKELVAPAIETACADFKARLVSEAAQEAAAKCYVSQAHDKLNGWDAISESEKRGLKLICADQIQAAIRVAEGEK